MKYAFKLLVDQLAKKIGKVEHFMKFLRSNVSLVGTYVVSIIVEYSNELSMSINSSIFRCDFIVDGEPVST